jgi:hypothetical protein
LFLLGEASLLETAGRFFIVSPPKSKKKNFSHPQNFAKNEGE